MMAGMNKTRVVIYARVSMKDKQDTENQMLQLRAFCSTQAGWELTHEYVDRVSGGRSDREEFQEMFSAASRREFDVVLFWALDRFSREGVYATLQYLQRLTAHGVGYRSFSEQYLDSCGLFKDAVISILATIARQERLRLSERTIAGLERARAQGRIGGRRRVVCDRKKVMALRETGTSLAGIAAALGVSKTTIHGIVNAEVTQ
jgi:DNA invertase Pin-like site-specific DNA recombinase